MTYRIYSNHNGGNIILPETDDLDEAHQLAHSAAQLGHDCLYRVFAKTGVTGEQWVASWSVLDGVVKQLPDPGIPTAHWGDR
jgi:hypothetical protein